MSWIYYCYDYFIFHRYYHHFFPAFHRRHNDLLRTNCVSFIKNFTIRRIQKRNMALVLWYSNNNRRKVEEKTKFEKVRCFRTTFKSTQFNISHENIHEKSFVLHRAVKTRRLKTRIHMHSTPTDILFYFFVVRLSLQWPYFCYSIHLEMRVNANGWIRMGLLGKKTRRKTCRWNFYHKVFWLLRWFRSHRVSFQSRFGMVFKIEDWRERKERESGAGTNKWIRSHTRAHKYTCGIFWKSDITRWIGKRNRTNDSKCN